MSVMFVTKRESLLGFSLRLGGNGGSLERIERGTRPELTSGFGIHPLKTNKNSRGAHREERLRHRSSIRDFFIRVLLLSMNPRGLELSVIDDTFWSVTYGCQIHTH